MTMSSSLAAADAPPSAGESEAVLASLSQRLRDMKGHAPSLSAIAMKGEEKVRYGQAAYTLYNISIRSSMCVPHYNLQLLPRGKCSI